MYFDNIQNALGISVTLAIGMENAQSVFDMN
jgi:hypothetical protein